MEQLEADLYPGEGEGDDLYGDLGTLQSTIENQHLLQIYESSVKENELLKSERDELKHQVQFLREQKRTLESNVLSVFHTATTEIERKNKMISTLQQDLAKLKAELAEKRR